MNVMKTITLIGMMGAGKTSCAKILAQKLQLDCLDIDSLIEIQHKCPISEIFEKYGEIYFRTLEKNAIKDNVKPYNMIVSIGGGAFENSDTQAFLTENSKVVYLQTSAEVIYERIKTDLTRPLLKNNMNIERIKNIINKREKNYEKANYIVNTDGKTIEQVVEEILGVLR